MGYVPVTINGSALARIALIKVFPGLNMPVAHLSAELLRAGHACEVFFFKGSGFRRQDALEGYCLPDIPMRYGFISKKPRGLVYRYSHCYTPITGGELALLLSELERFKPDAIGMSVLSTDTSASAQVADFLRTHLPVPMIWGGYGPTFEPDRAIAHADVVCIGEGEGVILDIAQKLDRGGTLTCRVLSEPGAAGPTAVFKKTNAVP